MQQPIDQFLEIEKNIDVYNFKIFDDTVHLWPMIRFQIIATALYEGVGINYSFNPLKVSYSHIFSYLTTTFIDRSSKARQGDFVFFGSDVSNIKTEQGYFNRLTEYFANEYLKKTIIIEQSSNLSYKRPRTYKNVFTHDDILIKSRLFGLFSKAYKKDLATIHDFVTFFKSNFPWTFENPYFWSNIETLLIRLCKEYRIKYRLYEKLMLKIKPKIVFLEDACYGYAKLALCVACKDNNIKLVEYQHGLISLNHPAYNYHNDLPTEHLKYLPDYFLSYGKYWIENCRIPIPVLNIGNPYLTQKLNDVDLTKKENQLLFASGGVEPEMWINKLLYLNAKLLHKGYKIVFRPHPSEHHLINTIYKPLIQNGIIIDLDVLYETLSKSKYVFSDFSTVLFESLAFKCIPIVLRTPGSSININSDKVVVVESLNDIIDLIGSDKLMFENIVYFWEENWKINFKKFISNLNN